MDNEKKRRRKALRRAKQSAVTRLNRKVYRMARDGTVGRYLSGHDRVCERYERSGFVSLMSFLKRQVVGRDLVEPKKEKLSDEFENVGFYEEDSLPRTLTDRFAQQFDSSRLVGLFRSLREKLLYAPLVMYGVMIFAFSLFTLLTQGLILLMNTYRITLPFLSALFETDTVLLVTNLVAAVVLMAASLPLIFAREASLYSFLMESALTGFVLRRLMGVRDTAAVSFCRERHNARAFVWGMIGGLLTFFVPPYVLLIALAVALLVAVVLNIPEFGLLLIAFFLPFYTFFEHATLYTLLACLPVLIGVTIKLLRGKRVLKIEPLDFGVIGFLLLILLGGIVSLAPQASLKSALIFVVFGAMYFAVTVLIKSRRWLERCLCALMASSLIVALLGIVEWLLDKQKPDWQDSVLFSSLSGRIVSLWENPNVLAMYLMVSFFVSLGCLVSLRAASAKVLSLAVMLSSLAALVLTYSRGAWVALAVALLLMLLIRSYKNFPLVALLLLGGVVAFFFLPDTIRLRLESIVSFSDSSVLYRLNIWRGCTELLRNCFLTGVGIGEEAFAAAYRGYALAGIEAAPHSHSLFLQIWLELGLMGLLLFLAVMLLLARSAFSYFKKRSFSDSQSVIVLTLLTAVGALLLNGLTDYIWYNYRMYLLFWLVVGLLTAARRIGADETDTLLTEADACDLELTLVSSGRKRNEHRKKR